MKILSKVSFLVALIYGVTFSAAVEFNLAAKQSMKSVNNKVSAEDSADAKFPARRPMKSAAHNEKPWPEQLHQRFPYETNGPMEIKTNKARVYETKGNPLTTTVTQNRYLTMINDGVEVVTYPVDDVGRYLSGGVLGECTYIFHTAKFVWSNDTNVPAASIVDGIGTPLELAVIYYKEEYGSFEKALSHPDGLAIYTVGVSVKENMHNPKFAKLKPYLKAVEEVNESIMVPVDIIVGWYDDCLKAPYHYYAYPGSYIDFETNKQYYCATKITHPLRPDICYISMEQFQVFQRFRNKHGMHYSNRLKSYSRDERPVVVASPTKNRVLMSTSN